MPITFINFYGGAPPFAAVLDGASLQDMADMAAPATGSIVTFTTPSGALAATVNPSGGSGSYTFSWAVTKQSENSDNGNRFSVASTGTTNGAAYNTLTINGARPATGGQVFEAVVSAVCTVNDGVAAAIQVTANFTVSAPAL